ncbi:hypothetical protein [Actinoplanes xinjiangensis]|uniref:hypothetical protein n=1 Tax=Actinoplanes xinjiangensis TaxID=512350 RepID=UPI0034413D01
MQFTTDPPAGWPNPRRSAARILSAVFLAVITGVIALVAVASATTGDYLEAIGFGLAAVLVAHVTAIGVISLWRPRPAAGGPATGVTDQGERGLAFAYARLPYYLLAVTVAVVIVLAAGFAVLMATDGTGGALAVVGAVTAGFLGWFLVVLMRLAPGTLVVTPSGIYHRSLVLEHFVPWDAVVDVLAREGTDPWITVKALPIDGTRQRRHTGRLHAFEGQALPFLVARSSWLRANTVPAYQAVKYYYDHPEQRAELAKSRE